MVTEEEGQGNARMRVALALASACSCSLTKLRHKSRTCLVVHCQQPEMTKHDLLGVVCIFGLRWSGIPCLESSLDFLLAFASRTSVM